MFARWLEGEARKAYGSSGNGAAMRVSPAAFVNRHQPVEEVLKIQLVFAQILQRFKVHLIPGHVLEVAAKATLKPRGGLPGKQSRR